MLPSALLAELGYPMSDAVLVARVAAVCGDPSNEVLVAEEDGDVVGFVAVHSFEMLHRPGRMGRITALVVAAAARGHGIGRQLLAAAEDRLRGCGCIQLEVTSAEQRADAHAFYKACGYVEKRLRFFKAATP